MTAHDFSVDGQRVLVVGAARSGVAAAHLLARRGARVTLTDLKTEIADDIRAAQRGRRVSNSAGTRRRRSIRPISW